MGHRPRQQAQHATHALEVTQRRSLPCERGYEFRMQRISAQKLLMPAIFRRWPGQRLLVRVPQALIGTNDLIRLCRIDACE